MQADPDQSTGPATPHNRRTFFQWLTYSLGAVAAALVGVPFINFFFKTPKWPVAWVTLGPVAKFPVDETRLVTFDNPIREPWDGITAQTGVYVRYEGKDQDAKDQFLVLAVNCAHLGCPVSWFPQSGLFMCPCHGGVYYSDGAHASGPPPRGLYHCVWRIRKEQLQIQAPHYPTLQDTLEQPA
jgi:menaquinol-cytochrome c reductase iron-sulfur subunit